MPAWTTDKFPITYTYATTTTVPHYTNIADCTGYYNGATFVTNEVMKEEFRKFAESIYRTLREMKYLNKDIPEEEFMKVLLGEDENEDN